VMKRSPHNLLGVFLLGVLCLPQVHAGNIIGFADNATSCGGSTLCSTDGTTGYTGTIPFNLSTISQWFQIDTDGSSHLAGQVKEPDGGSGNFLVKNDTGSIIKSYSLTITDTFDSNTPGNSTTNCGGLACQDFQIHGGAANYFTTFTLTGPTCHQGCGTDSAWFSPNTVTYNWSGWTGVPINAIFDLNFASWPGDTNHPANVTTVSSPVPEPTSVILLCSILVITSFTLRKKMASRS